MSFDYNITDFQMRGRCRVVAGQRYFPGWVTIDINPRNSVVRKYRDRVQRGPKSELIETIEAAWGALLQKGWNRYYALVAIRPNFHPMDLGQPKTPVSIRKSFLNSPCQSFAAISALLGAQAGLKTAMVSGRLIMENPGRSGGGHVVCAMEGFEGHPNGIILEGAPKTSGGFGAYVSDLEEGVFHRMETDKHSFVVPVTRGEWGSLPFNLSGWESKQKQPPSPDRPAL